MTSGFNADTTGLGYASFDGDHVPVRVFFREVHTARGADLFPQRFHVPAIESPATDGSAAVDWTKTSGGYLTVVQDPFLNDKREPVVVDPVVPTAPPIIYPREPQPPSSFSSLADWAGGMSASEDHDSSYASLRFYGDWERTYG